MGRLISCKSKIWSPNIFLSFVFSLVFEVFRLPHKEVNFYVVTFSILSFMASRFWVTESILPIPFPQMPTDTALQLPPFFCFWRISVFLFLFFTFKYLLPLAFVLLFCTDSTLFFSRCYSVDLTTLLKSPCLPSLKCHVIK